MTTVYTIEEIIKEYSLPKKISVEKVIQYLENENSDFITYKNGVLYFDDGFGNDGFDVWQDD
jgi:hypothetical protein